MKTLAEMVEMHISQIRRYESGQSQPTLDVIRKLAMALSVSADMLLFEKDERGPDEELKFQFEAVSRLDPEEKKVIRLQDGITVSDLSQTMGVKTTEIIKKLMTSGAMAMFSVACFKTNL